MAETLFWIYLINAVLLINHEIDSAYWKEWELFRLPGGITGFLVIHFPLLFLVLHGLVLVYQGALALTLWTGEEAPVEVMRQAAQAALK